MSNVELQKCMHLLSDKSQIFNFFFALGLQVALECVAD
jgi:hypothetical protein